ncbi:hypothetical protein [Spiroplasma apis]|uniref:Uncharacterized protein n=1 Tax=Spiroplasma apis B31 TaxID=1276258 RepID=V5RL31_SPIAP|nr:hypothetical protein [Spiroplasma apis]AHB36500.1 hypothetical protein SAPIS_v1c06550 [Spiroplasma apis B31]
MMKTFLNKEEKKLFSKKNIKKIKKEDFFSYLEMQETFLKSLKESYYGDNVDNEVTEKQIEKQEKYVADLNKYYYEVVLISEKSTKDPFQNLDKEFKNLIKPFEKIQKD